MLAMFAGAQAVHQYYLPDLVKDTHCLTCLLFCLHSFQMLNVFFLMSFIFQSIPELPPKPGELKTELLGYKVREEATAALQQFKAEQKVD